MARSHTFLSVKVNPMHDGMSGGSWDHIYRRTRRYLNGVERRALYACWYNMHYRVSPRSTRHDYYQRGIMVCDEWRDFRLFGIYALKSGWRIGMQIARRDKACNYTPANVYFVSNRMNMDGGNLRDTLRLANGVLLSEAADTAGVSFGTVCRRIFTLGWTEDDALRNEPDFRIVGGNGRDHG